MKAQPMASPNKRFRIGRRLETDRHLHVHIRDIATAIIKDDDEGVVVDIYPFKDLSTGPCASTWAHLHDLEPEEHPPAPTLTPWQRAALNSYDLGEFRYLAETETGKDLHEGLRDCGDSLLRFIVAELSHREDCTSFHEAVRRMTTARNQINDLIEDLQEAAANPAAKDLSYTARWLIQLNAASPLDAARQALAIQRDPASIATHFTVRDNATGETTSIDLAEEPASG